jgi:predicted DNA-binding transcriptional regulator AlpA
MTRTKHSSNDAAGIEQKIQHCRTEIASSPVLRAAAAAEYLGLSVGTLTKMRGRGDGPIFVKLGRHSVGYILDDLNIWRNDRRRRSTSDNGPVPPRTGRLEHVRAHLGKSSAFKEAVYWAVACGQTQFLRGTHCSTVFRAIILKVHDAALKAVGGSCEPLELKRSEFWHLLWEYVYEELDHFYDDLRIERRH